MKEIKKNLTEAVKGKNCLVKFGAEWCGPCKAVKPVLESLEKDSGIEIFDIDIDVNFDDATLFNVRSVPTVIAFLNGEPHKVLVGAHKIETYQEMVQELG